MSKAKKIVIRVLLIIFVVISVCSIILNVITIANALSKRIIPTGIISKNGCDVLHIASVADRWDSNSLSIISGDGVVEINSADRGWDLIPKKSGRCGVISRCQYGGSPSVDYDLYDITVDENLKIVFTQKSTYKFYLIDRIHCSDGKITVKTNDKSVILSYDTALKLEHEIESIYGSENGCKSSPDISNCKKIVCERNYNGGTSFACEFYISKDRLYYCNIMAGYEQWCEFVPDDFCSLDGINELLDLKD